jgi:hypothetical protein
MLGFFGAAGLSLSRVEDAIQRLKSEVPNKPFGFNLIHSPNEPRHEMAIAELYLREEIRLVEASAYLDLTLPLILTDCMAYTAMSMEMLLRQTG